MAAILKLALRNAHYLNYFSLHLLHFYLKKCHSARYLLKIACFLPLVTGKKKKDELK
ncbi:Uncharacterised protein [Legionella israelensis]|uniref:Uncharacterized protein n=1 Tax=Legionella israelensis TaxID=454 RepID=A0A0W0V4E4_9GAMM|nr:hypothetical protein Lisr_2315 [Legionella israelensis]SCX78494.1 hypothetical protein SAMN02746069_00173 [Legionella israelensis DSM 19235]STX59614.1 Uncharacterised protein [Legionella israelensis]